MFACIYIPDLAAEALLRLYPERRHIPFVVLEGTPPLVKVAAVNSLARQVGVHEGLTRIQAEGYLKASRGILMMRSMAAEANAHAALLDAACSISPRMEDTAPDTVLLDVRGLERLFGNAQQIARHLLERVTQLGVEANVAIAPNPDAAEHAARGYTGVTLIESGDGMDRLGALPLEVLFASEALRITRVTAVREKRGKALDSLARMQDTLERWGIRSFRALAMLPAASLTERLGRMGERLQTLALGSATRELVQAELPMRFEEEFELEDAVENIESLLFLAGRMLDSLCARLSARALCTQQLRIRFALDPRTTDEAAITREELEQQRKDAVVERTLSLPVPMNDARLFLKLLHLEWSSRPPGAPVSKLLIEADPARPRVAQAGLFVPLHPEPEKLELTLARIHRVLRAGLTADDNTSPEWLAGSPEILDTHQPGAFRMTRFAPTQADVQCATERPVLAAPAHHSHSDQPTNERSALTAQSQSRSLTPFGMTQGEVSTCTALALRVQRPSPRVEVKLRDGYPVRIVCEDIGVRSAKQDNVLWAAGPWRSSGNWWLEGEDAHDGSTALSHLSSHSAADTAASGTKAGSTSLRSAHHESGVAEVCASPEVCASHEVCAPPPNNSSNQRHPEERSDEGSASLRIVSKQPQHEDTPLCWAREEWDIALAITVQHAKRTTQEDADIRMIGRGSRETRVVLYRMVRHLPTDEWFIEGMYD